MPISLPELHTPGFSKKSQSIWNLLKADPTVAFSLKELMNHINTTSRATLYRHLSPLVDSNRISKRRHPDTREMYYFSNPNYQSVHAVE